MKEVASREAASSPPLEQHGEAHEPPPATEGILFDWSRHFHREHHRPPKGAAGDTRPLARYRTADPLPKASSIPPRARWITVHSNGPSTSGQSVLTQPGDDGTCIVAIQPVHSGRHPDHLRELGKGVGGSGFLAAQPVLRLLAPHQPKNPLPLVPTVSTVEGLIGTGRHERTGERLNYRNGFRDRTLDTRLGALARFHACCPIPDHPRGCGERGKSPAVRKLCAGSSPRVRGTLHQRVRAQVVGRIIPAGAGNADSHRAPARRRSDHPRGCGERSAAPCVWPTLLGSSPRVRGTQPQDEVLHGDLRIIPAGAGNALRSCRPRRCRPDHPRGCGERSGNAADGAGAGGSSPRVRGTRPGAGCDRPPAPDHPRGCGERFGTDIASVGGDGSSPRVRGTPRRRAASVAARRIIPAGAGNASGTSWRWRCSADHPRGCGEREPMGTLTTKPRGSSPRVRGTHRGSPDATAPHRIIPAGAGNARRDARPSTTYPDHPRGCGERARVSCCCWRRAGSSPRVRGTHLHLRGRGVVQRIIPAGAGNASQPRRSSGVRPDHPRGCGERASLDTRNSRPCGSSPRVRGTHHMVGVVGRGARIIPAGAGNARQRHG